MKLLRGSERDLKLDISRVEHSAYAMENRGEDRAESLPVITPQPAIKVITLFYSQDTGFGFIKRFVNHFKLHPSGGRIEYFYCSPASRER
jgi:hypothetical protein